MNVITMSVLQCVRCKADTKNGSRCKRTTCMIKDYCWQHLMGNERMAVRPSHIPNAGRGLFVFKEIKPNMTLLQYTGDEITAEQLRGRYAHSDGRYVVQIDANHFIDARSTQSSVARYANTCRQQSKQEGYCTGNNARLAVDASRKRVALKATRNIHAGDEIFVAYGRGHRIVQE